MNILVTCDSYKNGILTEVTVECIMHGIRKLFPGHLSKIKEFYDVENSLFRQNGTSCTDDPQKGGNN